MPACRGVAAMGKQDTKDREDRDRVHLSVSETGRKERSWELLDAQPKQNNVKRQQKKQRDKPTTIKLGETKNKDTTDAVLSRRGKDNRSVFGRYKNDR